MLPEPIIRPTCLFSKIFDATVVHLSRNSLWLAMVILGHHVNMLEMIAGSAKSLDICSIMTFRHLASSLLSVFSKTFFIAISAFVLNLWTDAKFAAKFFTMTSSMPLWIIYYCKWPVDQSIHWTYSNESSRSENLISAFVGLSTFIEFKIDKSTVLDVLWHRGITSL